MGISLIFSMISTDSNEFDFFAAPLKASFTLGSAPDLQIICYYLRSYSLSYSIHVPYVCEE